MLQKDRQQRGSFRMVKNALTQTEEGRAVLRELGYQIVIDTHTLSERIERVRT